jgi:hypothetical protein
LFPYFAAVFTSLREVHARPELVVELLRGSKSLCGPSGSFVLCSSSAACMRKLSYTHTLTIQDDGNFAYRTSVTLQVLQKHE